MEELVKQMCAKVGIDPSVAEKVVGVLQQQGSNLPAALSGDAQALTAPLSKLGLDQGTIEKIVAFLRENATQLQGWLSGQGEGILHKAGQALGKFFGGKEEK